jgi:hypothetical protein
MDAVADATAELPRLYPVGSVPASPTYPYGVFSAQQGRGDAYTLDSSAGVRWVRVTAQFFGKTSTSVLAETEQFLGALLDVRLSADGFVTTPLRLELDPTPPTRDPDAGGVLGVTTTLTATAEEA